MMVKLPKILERFKICIICEGNEEYSYLKRLNNLDVWNKQYEVKLSNAQGNGNIPARYQDKYQNGEFDLVLVFCDTERKPYEQFEDIKRKINEFHGVLNASDQVVMFANPCTMQIIIKHWEDVGIKSPAKSKNAPLIKKHTALVNYKARADQLLAIMEFITFKNYSDMRSRIRNLDINDKILGSSNFGKFMDFFESSDHSWIDEINLILES